MNNKQIIQLVTKHGGATLTKSLKAQIYNNGYQVALAGSEVILDITSPLFKKVIKLQQKQLLKNEYLGLWLNKDNNKVYIDKSIYLPNKQQAIKLARANKQISIFNWAIQNDIKLK